MSDFVKPFHLSPFEENINLKANRNWDDLISYTNNRNNGTDAFDAMRWACYGCRVYNDANISIAYSGVSQPLTFNSERFDPYGMHSTSVDPSCITALRNGVYHIFGHVEFEANATGTRFLGLVVDGTDDIAIELKNAQITSTVTLSISTIFYLSLGSFVQMSVSQNSGGALNVLSSGKNSPEFGMVYVGE